MPCKNPVKFYRRPKIYANEEADHLVPKVIVTVPGCRLGVTEYLPGLNVAYPTWDPSVPEKTHGVVYNILTKAEAEALIGCPIDIQEMINAVTK